MLHSATYGLPLIQWNLTDTLVLPSHIALLHCFLFLFGITQCGWHLENLFSVIDWFKMLSRHPRLSLSFGMVASPATHPTVCNLKYIPSLTGLPPSSWSSGVPPQKLGIFDVSFYREVTSQLILSCYNTISLILRLSFIDLNLKRWIMRGIPCHIVEMTKAEKLGHLNLHYLIVLSSLVFFPQKPFLFENPPRPAVLFNGS